MSAQFDAHRLAVPGIRQLSPYDPGLPIAEIERRYQHTDAIKLASNENPLGPSQRVLRLLQTQFFEVQRYPDGAGHALKSALAERHGVDQNQICLGNGSNDILDMLPRLFVAAGQNGIISRHAFVVYYLSLVYAQAEIKLIEARNYCHDLDAMAAAVDENTRLMFIANPNNPTGTWCSENELRALLERVPDSCIVVVDEAYAEYVSHTDYPDCITWLSQYPNLVVTRTFSKIFGLAGLRVGYALSNPEVSDLLNRVRQPFNCNQIGLAAAVEALRDTDHIERSRQMNDEQMAALRHGLKQLGLEAIESVGNFLCVDMGRQVDPIHEKLLRRGIIVRPIGVYGMPNHLRISIGTDQETQRLLTELERLKDAGDF